MAKLLKNGCDGIVRADSRFADVLVIRLERRSVHRPSASWSASRRSGSSGRAKERIRTFKIVPKLSHRRRTPDIAPRKPVRVLPQRRKRVVALERRSPSEMDRVEHASQRIQIRRGRQFFIERVLGVHVVELALRSTKAGHRKIVSAAGSRRGNQNRLDSPGPTLAFSRPTLGSSISRILPRVESSY